MELGYEHNMTNYEFDYTIGICGEAKAGKDTTAGFIKEELESRGMRVLVASLANTLKIQCAEAAGLPRAWFDDPEKKEHLRPLMQHWGDIRKNIHIGGTPLYWVEHLLDHYPLSDIVKADVLIVPDIRYDFEATGIRDAATKAGAVVKVLAVNHETTEHSSHSSENGISPNLLNAVLYNDHSTGIDEYRQYVKEWLPRLELNQPFLAQR